MTSGRELDMLNQQTKPKPDLDFSLCARGLKSVVGPLSLATKGEARPHLIGAAVKPGILFFRIECEEYEKDLFGG